MCSNFCQAFHSIFPGHVQIQEDHIGDIRFIVKCLADVASEKRLELMRLVRDNPIVRSRCDASGAQAYRKPSEVYYASEDLSTYFTDNPNAWFLDTSYPEEIARSFEELGVARDIRVRKPVRSKDPKGNTILSSSPGNQQRGLSGFEPNLNVDGLVFAVSHPTIERSFVVWQNIARPLQSGIRGMIETSKFQNYRDSGPPCLAWSDMGECLRNFPWLPLRGQFVGPDELSLDDLPPEFTRDEALALALGMKRNELATLARKAGVDIEALTLAEEITKDPELRAQVLRLRSAKACKPEFPSRPTPNPVRRAERVAQDAQTAPQKVYEQRSRSVRTSQPPEKPETWLRETYTNQSGQMVCQMCQEEMPFKKRDRHYYFESVESFKTLPQEHHALYLAFCPLCAAKYAEFVKRDPDALVRFQRALTAATRPEVSVQIGNEVASVRFVDSHFRDLQTILRGIPNGE